MLESLVDVGRPELSTQSLKGAITKRGRRSDSGPTQDGTLLILPSAGHFHKEPGYDGRLDNWLQSDERKFTKNYDAEKNSFSNSITFTTTVTLSSKCYTHKRNHFPTRLRTEHRLVVPVELEGSLQRKKPEYLSVGHHHQTTQWTQCRIYPRIYILL